MDGQKGTGKKQFQGKKKSGLEKSQTVELDDSEQEELDPGVPFNHGAKAPPLAWLQRRFPPRPPQGVPPRPSPPQGPQGQQEAKASGLEQGQQNAKASGLEQGQQHAQASQESAKASGLKQGQQDAKASGLEQGQQNAQASQERAKASGLKQGQQDAKASGLEQGQQNAQASQESAKASGLKQGQQDAKASGLEQGQQNVQGCQGDAEACGQQDVKEQDAKASGLEQGEEDAKEDARASGLKQGQEEPWCEEDRSSSTAVLSAGGLEKNKAAPGGKGTVHVLMQSLQAIVWSAAIFLAQVCVCVFFWGGGSSLGGLRQSHICSDTNSKCPALAAGAGALAGSTAQPGGTSAGAQVALQAWKKATKERKEGPKEKAKLAWEKAMAKKAQAKVLAKKVQAMAKVAWEKAMEKKTRGLKQGQCLAGRMSSSWKSRSLHSEKSWPKTRKLGQMKEWPWWTGLWACKGLEKSQGKSRRGLQQSQRPARTKASLKRRRMERKRKRMERTRRRNQRRKVPRAPQSGLEQSHGKGGCKGRGCKDQWPGTRPGGSINASGLEQGQGEEPCQES